MSKKKPFQLEFVFKASPSLLYNFLTTPSGLAQWFADSVDEHDGVYVFSWRNSQEKAYCLEKVENEFARFRWDGSSKDEYFEFRITSAEVTGDTILYLTDFADPKETESQRMLWENQIGELQKRIGG